MLEHEFPTAENGLPGYHTNCTQCLREYLAVSNDGLTADLDGLALLQKCLPALEIDLAAAERKVAMAFTASQYQNAVEARNSASAALDKLNNDIKAQHHRVDASLIYVQEALNAMAQCDPTIIQ
jgi:hypothetical protein